MASIVSSSSTPFLKELVDSSNLKDVPSPYKYINDEPTALSSDSMPVVDFSALTGDDPDQRSKAIHDIAKACEEWRFFIVVNHGMSEELMNAAFAAIKGFMSLGADEKKQYEANLATDPIKCGGFHTVARSNQNMITFWRENLKLHVHPKLHCPENPKILREVVVEYAEKCREISRELLGALSNAMELEQEYVYETLGLESSFQIIAANYYPPCPQPDEAIGIPPHTDHGLLTLLIHNGVPGLQIENNGNWFKVNSPKNSILVNVADNLESFSNGRYKTLKHRAVVNEESERMSIVSSYGPSKEAMVGPAAALVERDGTANYPSINYNDYVHWLLTKSRFGAKKSPLRFPHDDALDN